MKDTPSIFDPLRQIDLILLLKKRQITSCIPLHKYNLKIFNVEIDLLDSSFFSMYFTLNGS